MLWEQLDAKVKNYVQALRSAGIPIGFGIVIAAGEGIVRAHNRTQLMQRGGHIQITKTRILSLLKRMGFVKRKATTMSIPSMSGEEFERVKAEFLKQVAGTALQYPRQPNNKPGSNRFKACTYC